MKNRTIHGAISRFIAAVLAVSGIGLSGCQNAQSTETFTPKDYSAWRSPTTVVLNYAIPGHEDRFRKIFMNDLAYEAKPVENEGKFHTDYPDGALIVKEMYANNPPAPGEKPIMITGMKKAKNDPRVQAGWIWFMKDLPADRETVFSVSGNFCVNCHANANEAHPYGDKNRGGDFRDSVFYPAGTTGMTTIDYGY